MEYIKVKFDAIKKFKIKFVIKKLESFEEGSPCSFKIKNLF